MSSAKDTQSTDRGVQGAILQTGFRPSLYTVVAGSYAANHVYSSGAELVDSYDAVMVASPASRASVRKHDSDVEFDLKLTLDLSAADPAFPVGDELRVRVLPLSPSEPLRYFKALHPPSHDYRLPLFTSVEIVDPATGASIVPVAGQLQVRLLYGGHLALVVSDLTAAPPTTDALTAGDLAALFGGAPGDELELTVRGHYRA